MDGLGCIYGEDLSWTCMVCGDERPDRAISVAYRPAPGLETQYDPDNPSRGPRVNVRYCNDRVECYLYATEPGVWRGPPERTP